MSTVIDAVKRTTRLAIARRTKRLDAWGLRKADQAILDGLAILARQGLCAFPERDAHGLIRLTPEYAKLLGLDEGGADGEG